MSNKVTIELDIEDYKFLKELSHRIKTQNTHGTMNPIYCVEDRIKCFSNDTDGEPCIVFPNDDHVMFTDLEEAIDFVNERYNEHGKIFYVESIRELEYWLEDNDVLFYSGYEIEEFKLAAIFLTEYEAKRYMEYQKHNLTNPLLVVKSIGYANNGDIPKLHNFLKNLDL